MTACTKNHYLLFSSTALENIAAIFILTPLAVVLSAHAQGCDPPPSGIIGWWPGDGSAADIISTNNGTLIGDATYAAGLVGEAFSFDGSGACVELPPVSAGLPQGTIEFWFNLNSWNWQAAANGMFLWSGTQYAPESGASWDWMGLGTHSCCTTTAGELMFGIFNGGWQFAHSGVVPELSTWYHAAGTWGPAGLCIYVNGQLTGTGAYTGGASSDIFYNIIGSSSWPGSGIDGLVDEVSIYNRALSAAEIAAIFQAGSAGKCKGPEFQAVTLTNSTLSLTWSTVAGEMYQLQYTSDLSSTNWAKLGSAITATGATLSTNDIVTNAPQRFYRLVLSP